MNIEISNVCQDRVKEVAINQQRGYCSHELNIQKDNISLVRSGGNHILVKDTDSSAGVLINKLDLATMFPDVIDIRPFKKLEGGQATTEYSPEATSAFVSEFNKELECELLLTNCDVLKRPTRYTVELLREFVLFCRVYGFWQLDASDLDMCIDNDVLHIAVVNTHEHYTGNIKVQI